MRISDWSSDVCSSDLLSHQLFVLDPGSAQLVADDLLDSKPRQVGERLVEGVLKFSHLHSLNGQTRAASDGRGRHQVQVVVAVRQSVCQAQAVLGPQYFRRWCRSEEHTSELQSLM